MRITSPKKESFEVKWSSRWRRRWLSRSRWRLRWLSSAMRVSEVEAKMREAISPGAG